MSPGIRTATVISCLWAGVVACVSEPPDFPTRETDRSIEDVVASLDGVPLDSALALAEATYRAGDHAGARDMLTPLVQRSRETGDVLSEAKALTWLGLAAWRLGEYGAAGRLGREALDLKLANQLDDELFSSYNALGLLAWNRNQLTEASEHFERALTSGGPSGNVGDIAAARMNLALVQTEWGDFEAAREGFLAMRDTMAAFADQFEPTVRAFRMGAALTNLGMLEVRVGDPVAAVSWLTAATDIYREGYPAGEGLALGHLATAYALLGEQGQAFSTLDAALDQVRDLGLRQEEASNLEVMAEQYREAGDFRRALDLYEQAKAINGDLDLTVETGADLRGEAQIHLQLGAPERALESVEQALRLHVRAGATLDELYDHVTMAEVHHELGNADAASLSLLAARSLAEELAVRSARVAVAITEARIAEGRSDHEAMLHALGGMGEDLARSGYAEQWQSHYLTSRAYAAAGMPDSASAAGWRAVNTVERVRESYGSEVLRSAFSSNRRDAYDQLVSALVTTGRIGEAFAVSDAARGRALMERAPSGGDLEQRLEASTELRLREIDGVLESIDLIETGVTGVDADADALALSELYDRVDQLRGEYESQMLRAGGAAAQGSPGSSRVQEIDVREALRPKEILVEYFVPREGNVRVFVLSAAGLEALETPLSARNLASRVRVARELMSRADGRDASTAALEGLHAALLEPIMDSGLLEGIERLTIVPHDALAYLPFSALKSGATGRSVIQDFEVRVLPSAASLVMLADRSLAASGQWATGSVFAPLPSELPATRREAEAVSTVLGGAHRFVGDDATEEELRRALELDGPVHLATHGIMNSRNPMFSRVLLADAGSGGSENDGRLEVHEVLSLEANAPLVFLSGCETGVGRSGTTRFTPGDDYTTLAQAFLQAGVRNVIATLWRVDDQASAVFAELFYSELHSASPAGALASAQRTMRTDPRYSAPYYWAGYQLLGDDVSVK